MKTFVHEETEVKLTGRTAIKKVALQFSKPREFSLVEITPVEGFEWKKWVNPDHLYEIKKEHNDG